MFSHQNRETTTEESPSTIFTFNDYKIDYNHCLGEGLYGVVYTVVKRPENEKGFFATWFPYIYDWIYPVDETAEPKEERKYCVKIFKFSISVLIDDERLRHDMTFLFRHDLPDLIFRKSIEEKYNNIFRERGITSIRFFKTNSMYAQFKEVVHGETLHHYLKSYKINHDDHFELRKSIIKTFAKLKKSPVKIYDMHSRNIMYDEINRRMEVVDGKVGAYRKGDDPLYELRFHYNRENKQPYYKVWGRVILAIVKNEIFYDRDFDKALVKRIREIEERRITLSEELLKAHEWYLRDACQEIKQGKLLEELDELIECQRKQDSYLKRSKP